MASMNPKRCGHDRGGGRGCWMVNIHDDGARFIPYRCRWLVFQGFAGGAGSNDPAYNKPIQLDPEIYKIHRGYRLFTRPLSPDSVLVTFGRQRDRMGVAGSTCSRSGL